MNGRVTFRKWRLLFAGLLPVLLTGCPRNEYTLELTPRGNALERKLTFHRADGTGPGGIPKYEAFPSNELAAITAIYPAGSVVRDGERHTATGRFATAMPSDIGGAGSYTNLSTSLGSAGFYVERFRGRADLASKAEQKARDADQLADLVIGWSRAELGAEPNYEKLRRFLDVDFRRDVKNLAMYAWIGDVASSYNAGSAEEFIVRFGQYLIERGYVKFKDAPALFQDGSLRNSTQLMRVIRSLVVEKLELSETNPLPAGLSFLSDDATAAASCEKYLAGTGHYRARLEQWEKEKMTNPDSQKPEASEVVTDLLLSVTGFRLFANDDALTVRLSLPSAPTRTNGKWDESQKQLIWKAELEEADKEATRLPVLCYAFWNQPDESFQSKHFGRVIVSGDDLLQYCLWREGLDAKQAAEWEQLLSGISPGENLNARLEKFRFSNEPPPSDADRSAFARQLFKGALAKSARK